MKFTKKALREALKTNDQTRVWKLIALKVKHTPEKKEVYEIIRNVAITERDHGKAWAMAYQSLRKCSIECKMELAWRHRGGYLQYGDSHYRTVALDMLRRLYDEPVTNYTKVPMFGIHYLYFCHPGYGHHDYNKVRTCLLNGPLAVDKNGNRYDPQAAWCDKVVELGNRIYAKKVEG